MNNNFNQFNSKQELHEVLSQNIAQLLKEAIDEDGDAVLALSGGSTPKPLFEKLSNKNLPWEKVLVTLVDDRWVENTHNDSNEKLVREYLLQNLAKDAKFIPLKNDASTPFDGVENCNESLKKLKENFDVVILGMGTDGHTASFFPKDENLYNALNTDKCCAATIPSDAPHQRITLSLNKLLKAKHLFLHIEGDAKLEVYNKALENETVEEMPVRSILKDKKSLEVYYAK